MSFLEFLGVKPTLPRFAARLLKAMPSDLASEWSLHPAGDRLVRPGGSEISLQNMFSEYCASKVFDRAGLIQKYVSLAGSHLHEIPDLWVAAAGNIYPAIRSLFVDTTIEIKSRSLSEPYEPVVLPFVGDLRVRLMYDFGEYLGYIKGDKLATWGQSAEAVLERAIANLGRLEAPAWVHGSRGFSQLASEVSFEESMLLLDSVVRALPFASHAVLMSCNRGVLLAADSRSEQSIEEMLREAERCLDGPWPMSSVMCTRDESGWVEFDPPPALANLAHGLAIRHLAANFAVQKEELDVLHESRGDDIYVAEYSVIRVDEQWQSYCVWAQGVRALLPAADWVALLPEGEDSRHIRVPWPQVVSICGQRMAATDENPPRFRVEDFPDESEWTALEEHAIGE